MICSFCQNKNSNKFCDCKINLCDFCLKNYIEYYKNKNYPLFCFFCNDPILIIEEKEYWKIFLLKNGIKRSYDFRSQDKIDELIDHINQNYRKKIPDEIKDFIRNIFGKEPLIIPKNNIKPIKNYEIKIDHNLIIKKSKENNILDLLKELYELNPKKLKIKKSNNIVTDYSNLNIKIKKEKAFLLILKELENEIINNYISKSLLNLYIYKAKQI